MEKQDTENVLNELALTQGQLNEVIVAKAEKSMINKTQNAAEKMSKLIEEEANKYGQKEKSAQINNFR